MWRRDRIAKEATPLASDQAKLSAPALFSIPFFVTILLMLVSVMSFTVLLPVMPTVLREMGASWTIVGLNAGVYTITGLLIRPLGGYLSDRGYKVRAIAVAALIGMLCNLAYIPMRSITAILIVRTIHGLMPGLFFPAVYSLVSELIPPHRRGEGMGWFSAGAQIAMGFGPLTGIALQSHYGASGAMLLGFGLTSMCFLLCAFLREPKTIRAAVTRLYSQGALLPSAGQGLTFIVFGSITTFLPIWAIERGLTGYGWYFTTFCMVTLVAQIYSGRFSDRFGRNAPVAAGAVIVALSTIMLGGVYSMPALLGAAALFGIGSALSRPALNAMLIDRTPPQERGAAMTMMTASFDAASGLGGVVAGGLLGFLPIAGVYGVMAIFPVIVAIWFAVIWWKQG